MNKKGFTLIELIVVIVIIGLLALIAIPRVMREPNRARIAAAEDDVEKIREVCEDYKKDYGRYPPDANTYAELVASLVDPDGNPYMGVPESVRFTFVSYTGSEDSFLLTVKAHDNDSTLVYGTPLKIYHKTR